MKHFLGFQDESLVVDGQGVQDDAGAGGDA
jgi:hypothetical protein